MPGFPYRLLRLSPTAPPPKAKIAEAMLGIEVTVPRLAAICGLGNIDPQHGQGQPPPGSCGMPQGNAAIEVALGWPLPPLPATLATIRADADATGAMAVLGARATGRASEIKTERLNLIARSDCFDFGAWQDWAARHPPPPPDADCLSLIPHDDQFRALSAYLLEGPRPLADAVAAMDNWLMGGALPLEGATVVAAEDAAAAAAWREGRIAAERACDGRVALVRSAYRGATGLGYRFAPVVILEGCGALGRKVTIAQFAPGHIDLKGLCSALASREPGWGGSPTILGSPQGKDCQLSLNRILDLTCDYLA